MDSWFKRNAVWHHREDRIGVACGYGIGGSHTFELLRKIDRRSEAIPEQPTFSTYNRFS